ncbi:transposase [Streptomyces sp. NPDC046942]|uniref:transposase n=1 Tax=Streptomyces sp. NPDC046942 TaxID=3155137 RepID=UPI0033C0B190
MRTHWMPGLRTYAAEHDWLTLVALPTYAPELNPIEGIWSLIKRGPRANLAVTDLDDLLSAVRFALKRILYRPELVDDCLAETGLIINPPSSPTPTTAIPPGSARNSSDVMPLTSCHRNDGSGVLGA